MKLSLQLLALYPLSQAVACYKGSVFGHHKFNPRGETIPSRYLLELESSTSANFLDSLKDYQDVKVHHTYDHKLFQGLSIEIMNAENEDVILKSILDHPGIAFVTPNEIVRGSSATIQNHLNVTAEDIRKSLPHELHQVDRARKELNLTGEGVFVGIIDTGIDYRLPALGGCFGKGCKVITGGDTIGYTDPDLNATWNANDPIELCPDGSNSAGHGTHVAGIIGGYDPEMNFEGVAPGATLAMWRALGCDKSGNADSILQAALAAYDAGVDILSLSIGNSHPWENPEIPNYKVFKRMADEGVLVVVGASNDGAKGSYSIGSFTSNTFSVASIVNKYKPNPLNFRATGVTNPIRSQPLLVVNETQSSFVDGDLLIPFVKTNNSEEILFPFCTKEGFPADQIKGKVVALSVSTICGGALDNLNQLGAVGAILFRDNDLEGTHANSPRKTIPTTFVTISNYKLLYNAYKKNNGQVRIEFITPDSAIAYDEYEKTVSLFSSVGPTAELSFSPNIAAVGENVYSTVPIQFGRWGFMSGTSMATPYISGTLALYLQYHGKDKTKRDIIRAKFQNYATLASLNNQASGVIDNPLRQGSGYVQVYDSIIQTVYVNPPDVTFKDSTFVDLKTQELTITNEGTEAVTYRLYNNVSIAISPYNREVTGYKISSPSGNAEAKADVTFSQTEIRVNPGESQTVSITVAPPATNPLDYIMYGGFVQFNPVSEQGSSVSHKPIHVPYFGVVGNQKELPIFDTTSFSFQYQGPTVNYTYTSTDEQPPKIVHPLNVTSLQESEVVPVSFITITYNTFSPTELITVEIIDSSSSEVVGYLKPSLYSGVIIPPPSIKFDGTFCSELSQDSLAAILRDEDINCNNIIGSGTYAIRINGLKLNGVLSNHDDYDSWTSIPFTIDAQTA